MILVAHDLNWIDDQSDNENDQCVHGHVEFSVNDTQFIVPSDGLWNITVSALYLLRTIELSHTWNSSVAEGNYLFPCCGSDIYPWPKSKFRFVCHGCPNGIHISIIHKRRNVEIRLSEDKCEEIEIEAWKKMVCEYCNQVENFYAQSIPRSRPSDRSEREGWELFWNEWITRRRLLDSEKSFRDIEYTPENRDI